MKEIGQKRGMHLPNAPLFVSVNIQDRESHGYLSPSKYDRYLCLRNQVSILEHTKSFENNSSWSFKRLKWSMIYSVCWQENKPSSTPGKTHTLWLQCVPSAAQAYCCYVMRSECNLRALGTHLPKPQCKHSINNLCDLSSVALIILSGTEHIFYGLGNILNVEKNIQQILRIL